MYAEGLPPEVLEHQGRHPAVVPERERSDDRLEVERCPDLVLAPERLQGFPVAVLRIDHLQDDGAVIGPAQRAEERRALAPMERLGRCVFLLAVGRAHGG